MRASGLSIPVARARSIEEQLIIPCTSLAFDHWKSSFCMQVRLKRLARTVSIYGSWLDTSRVSRRVLGVHVAKLAPGRHAKRTMSGSGFVLTCAFFVVDPPASLVRERACSCHEGGRDGLGAPLFPTVEVLSPFFYLSSDSAGSRRHQAQAKASERMGRKPASVVHFERDPSRGPAGTD